MLLKRSVVLFLSKSLEYNVSKIVCSSFKLNRAQTVSEYKVCPKRPGCGGHVAVLWRGRYSFF